MRPLTAVGAGAAMLIVALVADAPATLVDGKLDAASAGRLRLAGATGTVWSGSGDLRLLPGSAAMHVAWRIDWWPLLWGEVRGTLGTGDDATPRASFTVAGSDFTLRDVAVALPADALLRAGGAPEILGRAGGVVALRADTLARRAGGFEGRANVRWTGADLRGLRPDERIALGDVRFDAAAQGKEFAGTLDNVGGDVEIVGAAALAADGSVRLDAVLRPRADIDAERAKSIISVLAVAGRPDGTGGYRIAWQ
jgi:general secretion pathway protein N